MLLNWKEECMHKKDMAYLYVEKDTIGSNIPDLLYRI